jgi:hypothetical protein
VTKTIPISDLNQLGAIMRTVRKSQHLRQDEVGRFSHTLIGDIEAGKPTAQIGKVIAAMRELGIRLHVEIPAGTEIPDGLREPMK